MPTIRRKAYVILDCTLLPIDRVAADRPYYSGKKKHHGVNVQVLADPAGRLLWVSDALPGAVHDLTAARTHGIPAALAADGIALGGQGIPGRRTRRPCPDPGHTCGLAPPPQTAITQRSGSLGERAIATLMCWRVFRKLRCSTTRITTVVRAIVTSNSPADQDGEGSVAALVRPHSGYPPEYLDRGPCPFLSATAIQG